MKHTLKIDTRYVIGTHIRSARKDQGLTLQELGDNAGISKQALWKIELGITDPKWSTVSAIMNQLSIRPEYLDLS